MRPNLAALDREQPVQFGSNGNVPGGCSRPVSNAFGVSISLFMKTLLKLYCWCMLFGDAVLISFSALTGCLGNGYPYARIHVGSFEVTSRMPGGAAFLIAIGFHTGVLAGAVLWLLKDKDSHSAEPDAPPNGGPAVPFGNQTVTEGPPSVS
jgi:hypothetical protein